MSTAPWLQHYDPLGNSFLSTLLAALPVVVLLSSIGLLKIRIHFAALLGLLVAFIGEKLVLQIVCDVWPELAPNDWKF